MHIRWLRKHKVITFIMISVTYYVVFHVLGEWVKKLRDRNVEVATHTQPRNEKRNFVYIKMFKCGSETLDAMFHRFALVRDLQCVLPIGNKLYLGWPYEIQESFYRPSLAPDGQFNVLSDHAVYSENMKAFMPKDTVFITSLRDTFSQFKSMFNYYNLETIMGIESSDPLKQYFTNQEKYEAIYKQPNSKKFCIPDNFSMSRNLMSFNLGFPTGFPTGKPDYTFNKTAINDWINEIPKTFNFVIIVEYFDESLVMLRHLMGWSLKDILYLSRNVGSYKYKNIQRQDLIDKYKAWSAVDYALYQKFLGIFNKRLNAGGQDLIEEIAHYKKVRQKLQAFCDDFKEIMKFEQSPWNEPFVVTKPFCDMLKNNLMDILKAIYDQRNNNAEIHTPSKNYC